MMLTRARIMVAIAAGALVLSFGAIGGASPVQAFGEDPYVEDVSNCQTLYIYASCSGSSDWCRISVEQTCTSDSGSSYYTSTDTWYDPFADADGNNICGLYVYCP